MLILNIKDNINTVKSVIPKQVTLVAVSKTKTVPDIREAYDCGIRDFGENKVQELLAKIDEFDNNIRWHLIGHLQTNKVKYIVGKVWLIHSLDSVKLLNEIQREYEKNNMIAQVLIEINIGREDSKSGVLIENLSVLLDACETTKNVKVKGLMAVIPKCDGYIARQYFKEMKEIWDKLKLKGMRNISMDYLSMGMTNDYTIAIKEGANMVRIGEGIFGTREYNLK